MSRPLSILALSGSLRAASTNTALLGAARMLAPDTVTIRLYEGLADLPPFNPDDETPGLPLPSAVTALRRAVGTSHALLIACPEYAHGVPGAFKNALDWLVGGAEFPGKPIALFHASGRGAHARASLAEILTTMSGVLVPEASVTVPLLGTCTDAATIVADAGSAAAIRDALGCLAAAVGSQEPP